MTRKSRVVLAALFLMSVMGCAPLQTGYETPVVTITSFEAIPTNNIIPQFKIGLHIVNPNRTQLILKGIAYTIALEGHKIMTGVSNKLPVVEAYGEGDVVLTASVDLFSGIGFFSDLIRSKKKESLSYSFDAKLDPGALKPLIRVSKKGSFSLSGNTL